MKVYLALIVLLVIPRCSNFTHLQKYPNFRQLSKKEVGLLKKIDAKLKNHPNKDYYYSKLKSLLETPQVKNNQTKLAKRQKLALKNSTSSIKTKIKKNFGPKEVLIDYGWVKVFPFGEEGPYFLLLANNPLDVKVKIDVYVDTDSETQQMIYSLEPDIEAHVSRRGFDVDLEFVPIELEGLQSTFTVESNHGEWATVINWSGGKSTMAHELMHLLGLDDEYNKIEMHYKNNAMSWYQRLLIFYYSIDQEIPEDAEDGIMVYGTLKPLQRHVCAIAQMGEDCVNLRTQVYGKWN